MTDAVFELTNIVLGGFPSRLFSTVRPALSETPAPAKGLYQFFENGEALPKRITTGRSWTAKELRQKSFEDLHKLWYVLLKERNVLATQRGEARRQQLSTDVFDNSDRMKKVRKSMARIKLVLNERQREYEKLLAEQQQQQQQQQ
ncbi:hypothetical protein VTP01DRAFT_7666 [Rhizomucor pusillus]|uniref:mitochondrial 54S ribosomal protein uL29m n=1 Tax=Rhizomucor pusillus TaxID=4840 RepID=UPI003742A0EF